MMVLCIHNKQSVEITNMKSHELVHKPVAVNKYPNIIGPINPPRPPIRPTIPPTTPISFGKYSGMCFQKPKKMFLNLSPEYSKAAGKQDY